MSKLQTTFLLLLLLSSFNSFSQIKPPERGAVTNPLVTDLTFTGKIAYKISAKEFANILNERDTSTLLGVQFFFKNIRKDTMSGQSVIIIEEDVPSDHIRAHLLYLHKGPNNKIEFRLSDENIFQLDYGQVFNVHTPPIRMQIPGFIDIPQHWDESPPLILKRPTAFNTSDQPIFEALESFQKDIGFVFFPIAQLRPMLSYYDSHNGSIVISGCQINLGMKLGRQEKNTPFENQSYFTLKIEGSYTTAPGPVQSITPDQNTSITEGPDIIIGQPCPPKWYSFPSIITEAIQQGIDIKRDYGILKSSWNQQAQQTQWFTVPRTGTIVTTTTGGSGPGH